MTGTIIAIITGLAFVAMAAYLVYQSTRIQYPEGVTSFFQMGACRVRLVHDRRHSLTHVVQKALSAVTQAWPDVSPPLRGELVIHITSKVYRNLHGVQTYCRAKIGHRRVPMLVIENTYDQRRLASLIIHEAGHLVAIAGAGHPDAGHVLPAVWQPVGGERSFEARAMALYYDTL